MKRILALLAVIAVLSAGFIASAARDFTGTWVLNDSKSNYNRYPYDMPGFMPTPKDNTRMTRSDRMIIRMAGNEMTMVKPESPPSAILANVRFVLDGAMHTFRASRGEVPYKATWNGQKLTIVLQRGGPDSYDAWEMSLSANGKTLTNAITAFHAGRDVGGMVMVYDRSR